MNYKIVDDTDCCVSCFDTEKQVTRYVRNHTKHVMTVYVLVNHSSCDNYLGKWQEIAYYGGER